MRRWLSWRIVLGAMLGLYLGWHAGGLVVRAQSQRDPVVGMWKIDVEPDDVARKAGERDAKDILTFKLDNTFFADSWKKLGFDQGKYDTDQRRYGPASFTGTIKSAKSGETKWAGIATGQNIEGTLVWTRKDGTVLNYAFKGERK